MALIIFGIGFGLLVGIGLFTLLILPALRERSLERKKNRDLTDE